MAHGMNLHFLDTKFLIEDEFNEDFAHKYSVCATTETEIEEKANCVRLNTCWISEEQLRKEFAKVEEEALRKGLLDSFMTSPKFPESVKFEKGLAALLKALSNIPQKYPCLTVKQLQLPK